MEQASCIQHKLQQSERAIHVSAQSAMRARASRQAEAHQMLQVMDMLVEQTHKIWHELRQNEKAMHFAHAQI